MTADEFQELLARVRAGDEDAATAVVRRYERVIRIEVRVHLSDPRMRRQFDSMDISQSVFGSFFVRAVLGEFRPESPAALGRLLVAMAKKKTIDQLRRHSASRRSCYRSRSLFAGDGDWFRDGAMQPDDEVALRELYFEFRSRLTSEELGLAERRLAGHSWEQIAASCGVKVDAVRKRLTRAIDRVSAELALGASHEHSG